MMTVPLPLLHRGGGPFVGWWQKKSSSSSSSTLLGLQKIVVVLIVLMATNGFTMAQQQQEQQQQQEEEVVMIPSTSTTMLEERQLMIQQMALNRVVPYTPIVEAYFKKEDDSSSPVVLNQNSISQLLLNLNQDRDAGFRILHLIRILYFLDNETDTDNEEQITTILNELQTIPFWITKEETIRQYWSENSQIIYMSSEYLLQQKYPTLKVSVLGTEEYPEYSTTIRQRLLYYLTMKQQYGFYEFFSSIYWPYTLMGLLNLVEFCTDHELQSLAKDVTEQLLSLMITVTNSKGSFRTTSGRNYISLYLDLDRASTSIIWMITGLGTPPTYPHHVAVTLATTTMSKLDISSIIDTHYSTTIIDKIIRSGPSLEDVTSTNWNIGDDTTALNRIDRTILNQWGMGAYFHPDVYDDTLYVVNTLELWDHDEFNDFQFLQSLPSSSIQVIIDALSSITKSSTLGGFDITIYKQDPVVLSSVQDFWSGHMGYQVFPWVATTGTLSIFTQSGEVVSDWYDRPTIPSQTHLPKLQQSRNVALIMYNPNDDLDLIGTVAPNSPLAIESYDVSLLWPGSQFDAQESFGRWLFGQEGNGYVAIARHCYNENENVVDIGIPTCNDEYQTWAVIVGSYETYNSFDEFIQRILTEAKYISEWRIQFSWTRPFFRQYYYGEISFDNIRLRNQLTYLN